MRVFILLCLVGLAVTDLVIEERRKQDICEIECGNHLSTDAKPDAKMQKACERGCRFFSLVRISLSDKAPSEIVDDAKSCSHACSEAYTSKEDSEYVKMREHCELGCVFGHKVHEQRKVELAKQRTFIQPSFNEMFSDLDRMGIFANPPFSHLFNMMRASVERMNQLAGVSMSVVVSEEQDSRNPGQPDVIIVKTSHSGILPSAIGMEDPFEDIQGSNTRFMDNDPFPRIKTATAVVQEVPRSSDWLECVSRKAGIPRWLLLTSIFLCSLMFVWLCFAAAGPSQEKRVYAIAHSPNPYSCKQPWNDMPYFVPQADTTTIDKYLDGPDKNGDKQMLIEDECDAPALPAKIHFEKV